MTIKQKGGIFGRNPTFNNVEVDGTATLDNIAASNKLRVTASQNPAAYLEFENTFQNAGIASQAGLLLGVNSSVQTNYAGVIATENANNSNGVLLGLYANNGSGPLLVARAKNDQNFEIVTGNLVIGTSGKGIDFSATAGTGTSELFDDYEEGTWTPVYNTNNGDLANFSPSGAFGKYIKVGTTVTVYGNIATTQAASISGTGRIVITGLPFTPSIAPFGAGVNFTALTQDNRFTNNPSFGYINNGETTVNLYKTNAMNTANALVVADMNATNTTNFNLISFCVTYPTA